ncbi:MAG: MBL fold metallo-hydrolase [Phycisphaerae bacterium]|nr:MBL fold metallo-hydrolase [Phycisphaerae bacterium]
MGLKISFLGAVQNVTGSRHLIQTEKASVLVDCGYYQERQYQDRNWDPFPFSPSKLDAILLTHAHLDHCGLVPKLVKEGFKGKIFCTTATAEIASVIMYDSARLQLEDIEYKKKRHAREKRKSPRPLEPLFTIEDVEDTEPLFATVDYKQKINVADGIDATFFDSGHILGSSMIYLNVETEGKQRTVLCSGDIGRHDKPILNDPSYFDQADYVLVESTYGDRIHKPALGSKDELADIINDTVTRGGNIVIPSFAVERAQELLYHINELVREKRIPRLMTFLDSPMAVKVTEIFKNHPEMYDEEMTDMHNNHQSPFNFNGLTMTPTTAQSKAINNIKGSAIIIAGSGMCTGGRIKHHLAANISRPESTIVFVGYQAQGTLGRLLLEGKNPIRIIGQQWAVNAKITKVHGLSGHADRNELTNWITALKTPPKQIFVVHGETEASDSFKDHLKKETGWNVTVPSYQETFELE